MIEIAKAAMCPSVEELNLFAAGALSPLDTDRLSVHIEQCPSCLGRLQALPPPTDDGFAFTNHQEFLDDRDSALVDALIVRLKEKTARSLADAAAAPTPPVDLDQTREAGLEARPNDFGLEVLTPSGKPGSFGRLGSYEILEVIGTGGFGIVYKAFDESLQRVVAVKMMSPQLAATAAARKRFLREARAGAAVRHENVVQIYSIAESPIPYLVMEYIPGETLLQLQDRNGPLAVSEILRFGEQLARGLAAAHQTGLIHRDIKPGNVLIESSAEPRAKLTDFGLARAADDASMTQSGTVAGTPMYMAPEQARGETLDFRADLFSLGSVLYTMTSGQPPFRAANTLAVLKRVAEETPQPVREIIPEAPAWLCNIINRLLEKDPARRFQSASEVAEIFAACREQLQRHGKVTLAAISTTGPALRRKTVIAIGLTCLLMAAGSAFFLFRTSNDTSSQHDLSTTIIKKSNPLTNLPLATLMTSPDYRWSSPKSLGWVVNHAQYNYSPRLTPDGLELWFVANGGKVRGSYGEDDIWISRRDSIDAPWQTPINVNDPINTPHEEREFDISADRTLLIMNRRQRSLWSSTRRTTIDDWSEPLALFDNAIAHHPTLTPDGLELYCNFGKSICRSVRKSRTDPWPTPSPLDAPIAAVNGSCNWISPDRLVMILECTRPENVGEVDLWFSIRPSIDAPWGELVHFGPTINTKAWEHTGNIFFGPDGPELYFSRGEGGPLNLLVSRLVPKRKDDK